MAKTGFWLRGAKGKLAGATIYDGANGTTMREVVKPSNPKTNAQMIQRAIMATVMKAYGAGKVIFDHSFQGKSVGMENQREFMRLNANALRSALSQGNGFVVAPKAISPVANNYIVSRGSYQQTIFGQALNTLVSVGQNTRVGIPGEGYWDSTTATPLADYCKKVGLVVGDIYTLIAFGVNTEQPEADYDLGSDGTQYIGNFGFVRMIVKQTEGIDGDVEDSFMNKFSVHSIFEIVSNIPGLADVIGTAALSDLVTSVKDPSLGIGIQHICGTGFNSGAIGCIRSREDLGLRSNTTLQVVQPADFGITFGYLLDAWKAGIDKLGSSDLILEGGSLNARSATPQPQELSPNIIAATVNGVAVTQGETVSAKPGHLVQVTLNASASDTQFPEFRYVDNKGNTITAVIADTDSGISGKVLSREIPTECAGKLVEVAMRYSTNVNPVFCFINVAG